MLTLRGSPSLETESAQDLEGSPRDFWRNPGARPNPSNDCNAAIAGEGQAGRVLSHLFLLGDLSFPLGMGKMNRLESVVPEAWLWF